MPEVLVVCEGQTEREFCRDVIAPELAVSGVYLAATLVGKPQRKKGGIRDWNIYRKELLRLAKERADRHLAVLVDYYAMPDSWPGRKLAPQMLPADRGRCVEEALLKELASELSNRFHPCIQLHEFETLIFVDPDASALSIAVGGGVANHEVVAKQLKKIKEQFGGAVEAINDDPLNAPSKRIERIIQGYDKVAWGVTATKDVTVRDLRAGCPWLDRWLNRLGALAGK